MNDYLVGGAIGGLLTAFVALISLYPRIQRLEQWAWGANNDNGVDSNLKELRRDYMAHLRETARHEAMQDRRNLRQHPADTGRQEDVE